MLRPPGNISAKVYEIGTRWRQGERLLREQSNDAVAECSGSIVNIYPLISIPIADVSELVIVTLKEIEIHTQSIIVSLQSTHPLTSLIKELKTRGSKPRNAASYEELQEQLHSVETEQTKLLQRALDLNLEAPEWVTGPLAVKQRSLREKIRILELTDEVQNLKKQLHAAQREPQNQNITTSARTRKFVLLPNSRVRDKTNINRRGTVTEVDGDWVSILWDDSTQGYPTTVECPAKHFESWPVCVDEESGPVRPPSSPVKCPPSSPVKAPPSSPARKAPPSPRGGGSFSVSSSYFKSVTKPPEDVPQSRRVVPPMLSTQPSSVSGLFSSPSTTSSPPRKSVLKPAPKSTPAKKPVGKVSKPVPSSPLLFAPVPVTESSSGRQTSLSPPASKEMLNRTVPVGASVGDITNSSQDITVESHSTDTTSDYDQPKFFLNIKPPSDKSKPDASNEMMMSAAAAAAAATASHARKQSAGQKGGDRRKSLTEKELTKDDPLVRFRKRSSLSTHSNYSSTSPYTVTCKWCGQNASQEHEHSRCAWRQISCHHCQTVMVARDYKAHLSGKCSRKQREVSLSNAS